MMSSKDSKIAVMQPYIFPYVGYFQLMNAVDKFVFYEDVNFIKQGWINRNTILGANEPITFAVPLKKASSFKPINETEINLQLYVKWKKKFFKSIKQTYGKAPYFETTFKIIEDTFNNTNLNSVADLAISSVYNVSSYLDQEVEFIISSNKYPNTNQLERTERLFYICNDLNAINYINAIGGQKLYDKRDFENQGVKLQFLKTSEIRYNQFSKEFVPNLSIIDVLMFNSKDEVKEMLTQYSLI